MVTPVTAQAVAFSTFRPAFAAFAMPTFTVVAAAAHCSSSSAIAKRSAFAFAASPNDTLAFALSLPSTTLTPAAAIVAVAVVTVWPMVCVRAMPPIRQRAPRRWRHFGGASLRSTATVPVGTILVKATVGTILVMPVVEISIVATAAVDAAAGGRHSTWRELCSSSSSGWGSLGYGLSCGMSCLLW